VGVYTATLYHALQHIATRYNALQHTALQHTSNFSRARFHGVLHCITLQHAATRCSTLQSIFLSILCSVLDVLNCIDRLLSESMYCSWLQYRNVAVLVCRQTPLLDQVVQCGVFYCILLHCVAVRCNVLQCVDGLLTSSN